MNKENRVVITGLGVVSAIGVGKNAYWNALEAGHSGINKITSFDTSNFYCKVGGEVRDLDLSQFISPKLIKRTDRSTHLALVATQLAIDDSGINIDNKFKQEAHVILGTAMSGQVAYSEQLKVYHTVGQSKVSPFAAVSCFPDACSGQLNIFFKLKGPSQTICAGCAASTNAIIEGYKRIKMKETSFAIVGGTDAPLCEEIFCGFCQAGVFTSKTDSTPAPFDKNRDGTVLSEGAGILILEELEHALNRNAEIYAEIVGYGCTTDAYQMAGSDPSGEQRIAAIQKALKNANVRIDEIDYVNAHATATKQNDQNETEVLKAVFGEHAYKLLINATKSMIGHAQGAAGALETIAGVQALYSGVLHPTINYSELDENCDLNYLPNNSLRTKINYMMKNSFAFGGKNSILILKAFTK